MNKRKERVFKDISDRTNTHGLMGKNTKKNSLPQYILNLDEFKNALYNAYKQQPIHEVGKMYFQGLDISNAKPNEIIRTEVDMYIQKITLSFNEFRNTDRGYHQRIRLKIDDFLVIDEVINGEVDLVFDLKGEFYIPKGTKIQLTGYNLNSTKVTCNIHSHLVDEDERLIYVICKHRATDDILKVVPMSVKPIQTIQINAPVIDNYTLDDDSPKTLDIDYYSDPVLYVEFYYKTEKKTIVVNCVSAYDGRILEQETIEVEPPLTVKVEVEEFIDRPEGEWYIIEDTVRDVKVEVNSPAIITEEFKYKLPEKTVEVNAICINIETGEYIRSETAILTFETNASVSFSAPDIVSHELEGRDFITVHVDRFSEDVVNVYFTYYYIAQVYWYLDCYLGDTLIYHEITLERAPRILKVEAPDLTGYELVEPEIPWKHLHLLRETRDKDDLTITFDYKRA